MKSHLPYTKCSYATGTKTINAERIVKSCDKKNQQEGTDNAKN